MPAGFLLMMDGGRRHARMPVGMAHATRRSGASRPVQPRGAEGCRCGSVRPAPRQRRDIEGQPMASSGPRARGRPVSIAVSATAPARCRASGRAVAAGRCPHQRPQPVEPVRELAGRSASALALALSGFTQRRSNNTHSSETEQRSPIGAGDALFQVLDVADEPGHERPAR